MSTRSFECRGCGAAVPSGRLSCPECGELLASVSGGVQDDARPVPEAPAPAVEFAAADEEPVVDGVAAASPPELAEPDPVELDTPIAPPPAPLASYPPDLPGAYVPPGPQPAAAGGYVPAGPISPAIELPAGPPAPARAWGGLAAMGAGTAAAQSRGTSSAEAFDLRDPVRRAEAIGWLGVAGAAIAAAGFLLPWATTMIGSGGVSYVDQWGLAGPGHILVVLGLVAVAALTVVQNPVPAWIRLGLPGVALGSLLVGLAWPYLFGPLGSRPGLMVSLVGALVLLAAGIACLAADRLDTERHASPDRPV
jgi:hypothetical protein